MLHTKCATYIAISSVFIETKICVAGVVVLFLFPIIKDRPIQSTYTYIKLSLFNVEI